MKLNKFHKVPNFMERMGERYTYAKMQVNATSIDVYFYIGIIQRK